MLHKKDKERKNALMQQNLLFSMPCLANMCPKVWKMVRKMTFLCARNFKTITKFLFPFTKLLNPEAAQYS